MNGMGRTKAVQTILQCPVCQNKVHIWRKVSRQKQPGHIKHMYCFYCKETRGFVELKNDYNKEGWISLDGEEMKPTYIEEPQAPEVFFSSDWHFGHDDENIWKRRGFSSVKEHDEEIIRRHNESVGIDDIVYFLGDVAECDIKYALSCVERLNGNIYILRGEHDTDERIQEYAKCLNVKDNDSSTTFLRKGRWYLHLCHAPIDMGEVEERKDKFRVCLHGHNHGQEPMSKNKFYYYNVGMDAQECYPVSLKTIKKVLENNLKEW